MKNRCTGLFKFEELDEAFLESIESICISITQAGFDPYSQLTGYLLTGKDYYITRTGDARSKIESLGKDKIQAYVKIYLEK